jgi:hypothetical protein
MLTINLFAIVRNLRMFWQPLPTENLRALVHDYMHLESTKIEPFSA